MAEVCGVPERVRTRSSAALSWTGASGAIPLRALFAAALQPPGKPSLAPSPGLHLLQRLETSLHLNKGLPWDLTPHGDPASSPQPCSKLLPAALHNLAFNENYTTYRRVDAAPAAQQSRLEDVPTPCASPG